MKLHSPQFESALQQRLDHTIRSSEELKRLARQAKKSSKSRRISDWAGKLVFLLLPAIITGEASANSGHASGALLLLAFWGMSLALFQAAFLDNLLRRDPDLMTLRLLPVESAIIFNWQTYKLARRFIVFAISLVGAFGVFAFNSGMHPWQWLVALPVGLLSWLVILALAAHAVAFVPPPSLQKAVSLTWLLWIALAISFKTSDGGLMHWLDLQSPQFLLAIPSAWPMAALGFVAGSGTATTGLTLAAVVLTIALAPVSLDRRRRQFAAAEHNELSSVMIDPGADRQEASGPDRATVAASERAECERLVRSRAFLAVKAPTGLIESLLWRWLTARDRLVAEFIFPNGYVIGNLWRQAYGLLLFAAALSWIAARYAPGWWNWIVGIGIFVAGLIVTRCVLSSGAAFRVTTQGATTIPYHACYGLGYTELSRVLFKHSLVQLPLLVPFCAACALLAGPAFGWPPAASTLDGVKAAGLLLALRPLGITMSFSSHSNDTSGFRPRSVVIFTSMAVLGIAFIGLGAGSLPFPTAPIACICWLVAMVAAGLLFLIHRWFYNTNRFDLIGVVQR